MTAGRVARRRRGCGGRTHPIRPCGATSAPGQREAPAPVGRSPLSCAALVPALPIEGPAFHGKYANYEVYTLVPMVGAGDPGGEWKMIYPGPGDLMFIPVYPGAILPPGAPPMDRQRGVLDLAFWYERGNCRVGPGGPGLGNIIATGITFEENRALRGGLCRHVDARLRRRAVLCRGSRVGARRRVSHVEQQPAQPRGGIVRRWRYGPPRAVTHPAVPRPVSRARALQERTAMSRRNDLPFAVAEYRRRLDAVRRNIERRGSTPC